MTDIMCLLPTCPWCQPNMLATFCYVSLFFADSVVSEWHFPDTLSCMSVGISTLRKNLLGAMCPRHWEEILLFARRQICLSRAILPAPARSFFALLTTDRWKRKLVSVFDSLTTKMDMCFCFGGKWTWKQKRVSVSSFLETSNGNGNAFPFSLKLAMETETCFHFQLTTN